MVHGTGIMFLFYIRFSYRFSSFGSRIKRKVADKVPKFLGGVSTGIRNNRNGNFRQPVSGIWVQDCSWMSVIA